MTSSFKTGFAAAALAAALATTAQAGTLLDAASIFSIQGNTHGVAFLGGDDLAPISSFSTPAKAEGMTYGAGGVFVSTSDGDILGDRIRRYGTSGNVTDSIFGGAAGGIDYGALAYGDDTLFAATSKFNIGGPVTGVDFLNLDLTPKGVGITLPEMATGLAFGDNSLFVAYGSVLARYDLAGNLISGTDYLSVDLLALAYGDGRVFAGYTSGVETGWASIDPLTYLDNGNSFLTDGPVTGLAFGDGALYVGTEFSLAKYKPDGSQLGFLQTGPVVSNGPLAFIPQIGRGAGAVPEPSAWAMMILGFGAAGSVLRSRRRLLAA